MKPVEDIHMITEPYEEEFEYRGIQCFIRTISPSMHLCGYASFRDDTDIDIPDINVHGGITYDEKFPDAQVRIIGFDCAHPTTDIIPCSMDKFSEMLNKIVHMLEDSNKEKTYKDLNFVRNEIKSMVDQVLDKKG